MGGVKDSRTGTGSFPTFSDTLNQLQLERADYAYNVALFLPSFETSCGTVIVQLYNGLKGGN